jgi:hypothetical protein
LIFFSIFCNSVDEVLGEGFPGRIVKRFGRCRLLYPWHTFPRVHVPMAHIFENFSTLAYISDLSTESAAASAWTSQSRRCRDVESAACSATKTWTRTTSLHCLLQSSSHRGHYCDTSSGGVMRRVAVQRYTPVSAPLATAHAPAEKVTHVSLSLGIDRLCLRRGE